MRCLLLAILIAAAAAAPAEPPRGLVEPIIDFDAIQNPVYEHPGWSVKDACMIEKDGVFHLFFSAFFEHEGRIRSHIASVETADFLEFSEPALLWNGMEEGWIGMCSPSIREHEGTYYLFYNSWGDKPGQPNALFYATSSDLREWDKHQPMAHALTEGQRAIDADGWFQDGRFLLVYKQRSEWEDGTRGDRTRMAMSTDGPGGDFEFIGDGFPEFLMLDGRPNGNIHENYCFLEINDRMHILTTDYRPAVHAPYIYRMPSNQRDPRNWLRWTMGFKVQVPIERFNTDHNANAAFIVDWRGRDGYFYLLYAGRTEGLSFDRRGDNRLGLARSTDLMHWEAPRQWRD